jgi:hypothetical protein
MSISACRMLFISASTAVFLLAASLLGFSITVFSWPVGLRGERSLWLLRYPWRSSFVGDRDLLTRGLPTALGVDVGRGGWLAVRFGMAESIGNSSPGPVGPRGRFSRGPGGMKCREPFSGRSCFLYSISAFLLGHWLLHASWIALQLAHFLWSFPSRSLSFVVRQSWVGWESEHHPHLSGL